MSVESRCENILKNCTRFWACYNSIQGIEKSGISHEDELHLLIELFNSMKVFHPRENNRKPFRFMRELTVQRYLPKLDHLKIVENLNANRNASGKRSAVGTVPATSHRLRLLMRIQHRAGKGEKRRFLL